MKTQNFKVAGGKVHRIDPINDGKYYCGLWEFSGDKPTTDEVTCKHCLRVMKAREDT